jgi:hypothetical protein
MRFGAIVANASELVNAAAHAGVARRGDRKLRY